MKPAPTLLLDVMDTLVVEPYWTALPAFFGLDLPGLQAAQDPHAWVEFEHGRLDEAGYLRRVFADRRAVDGEALRACLRASYRWVDGMDALLPELAASGRPIHALSNYSSWYRLIDETLGLSRWLEWTFVSAETGLRKPDPAAFTQVEGALGVPPEQCLFVDDRQVNVDAAAAQGMQALLFTDAASLRGELSARGLLPGG